MGLKRRKKKKPKAHEPGVYIVTDISSNEFKIGIDNVITQIYKSLAVPSVYLSGASGPPPLINVGDRIYIKK